MPEGGVALARRATLTDALDEVLNRGAVIVGEARIGLADVDLIYLGLNLVLGSVEAVGETAHPAAPPAHQPSATELPSAGGRALSQTPSVRPRQRVLAAALPGFADLLAEPAQPASAGTDHDLVRLVLTLVELLRQLLERQALRRMEGGTLTEVETERLGSALADLADRMAELRDQFGLSEEDLNLDLGPLGGLLP